MKTTSARQLLITLTPSLFILLVMVITSVLLHVKISTLTRDFAAIANIHPLSGMLSNLGVLLWCVSASISGFAAIILREVVSKSIFRFLLFSSLLSVYLLLDDFFLFHENLASRYLGLSEKLLFVALGIALFTYLIVFRRIILQTNFSVLLLALGFLATSVGIDVILESWSLRLGHWTFFFEDGAKWLGIASWCSYYVHTSYQLILVSTLGLPKAAEARR